MWKIKKWLAIQLKSSGKIIKIKIKIKAWDKILYENSDLEDILGNKGKEN